MDSFLSTYGLKGQPKTGGRALSGVWLYVFYAVNLVVLALVLFDAPLGAKAGHFSPVTLEIGRTVTDVGKSGWILFISAYILMAGWSAMRDASEEANRQIACLLTQAAGYIFLTVAASGLTANLLKRLIGRARPTLFEAEGMLSFHPFAIDAVHQSFPSGHATTVAALFVALALLMPRLRIVLVISALWLGMSRVIVGAHYPSDVIAGLALGAWFSYATAVALAKRDILFQLNAQGWPELQGRDAAVSEQTP